MSTTPTDQRAEFVAGLRALATFIESHPDLPVPPDADVSPYLGELGDAEKRAEVDRIAAVLGVEATVSPYVAGHYKAQRRFGPVAYSAVAITAERMARCVALSSYSGAVSPDEVAS